MSKQLTERRSRRHHAYHGKAVSFLVDEIVLPNGKRALREYMDHPGAVAAIPFVDRDTIILVQQYRYPIGRLTWELPAGKLDKGEHPLRCVRRELREETGFTARRIRHLMSFFPAPAFSNERLHIYLAEGLIPGRASLDEDEFLRSARVPFRKALDWVLSGRIQDSKTVIALLACALDRRLRKGSAAPR